jgi:hypothetical protein
MCFAYCQTSKVKRHQLILSTFIRPPVLGVLLFQEPSDSGKIHSDVKVCPQIYDRHPATGPSNGLVKLIDETVGKASGLPFRGAPAKNSRPSQ